MSDANRPALDLDDLVRRGYRRDYLKHQIGPAQLVDDYVDRKINEMDNVDLLRAISQHINLGALDE
jgi:hypothetical protein